MFKKEKIMLPAFFELKLCKRDTLESETIELFVRFQTVSTTFEKILINREVPLLLKCNLLLLRQVLSMLLLFIKIIPLPLHKFSTFLSVSLILSAKS